MFSSVRRTPVANIDIRTPYFSGTVRALCMERPLYDIIIGNVEAVKDTEDEDAVQLSDDIKTQQDQDVTEEGQAVVTRSQSKQRVTKPLSVAEAIDTTISTESNKNNNNNKRQFVRRRNMSVDITRAPYRQGGNAVRDSLTETRL